MRWFLFRERSCAFPNWTVSLGKAGRGNLSAASLPRGIPGEPGCVDGRLSRPSTQLLP